MADIATAFRDQGYPKPMHCQVCTKEFLAQDDSERFCSQRCLEHQACSGCGGEGSVRREGSSGTKTCTRCGGTGDEPVACEECGEALEGDRCAACEAAQADDERDRARDDRRIHETRSDGEIIASAARLFTEDE